MHHQEIDLRPGDRLQIGPDVSMLLMDIWEHRCRFGFEAPRAVRIDRLEIRRLKDQKRTNPNVTETPSCS